MLDLKRVRELRIKRANTDWWINSKAVVAENGKTYIGYYTDMGEIHMKELDAKCSKVPSRDFRLCTLNCTYADEHNSPSVCVLKSGRIIVAYTGHNVKNVRYRFTEKPYDISSFGQERALSYEGTVTYVQLYENTKKREVWMFSRVDGCKWVFRYSRDEGETWSRAKVFLNTNPNPGEQFHRYVDAAEEHLTNQGKVRSLFYIDVRKQDIVREEGEDEQWFFALYGHPYKNMDHTIRSGIFNSDGQLLKNDGTVMDLNLYEDDGKELDLKKLDVVYEAPAGTSSRLLDVSSTLPLRVAFATFTVDNMKNPDPSLITYYSASFYSGKWRISEPICKAGEFLANNIDDGSQTYLGGMAYYYGVGDYYCSPDTEEKGAGATNFAFANTNRIYIARFDGTDRVLESYVSRNFGKTYELEQEIRRIPGVENRKIWRPTVPVHAQDNMPVYWHEGTYAAHTGGWHCDTVMLVEYDD